MSLLKGLFIFSFAVAFFGCDNKSSDSRKSSGIDPTPQAQADANPEQSFKVAPTSSDQPSDSSRKDKSRVVIKKSALNKEFLLSVNMLAQAPTPSFSSLQSRVISFIQRDRNVYILDVTGNNRVGDGNIPQNLLIAQLPVIKESASDLEVDFNAGMNQVFTVGDMFASDDSEGSAEDFKMEVAKVNISYLDEVTLNDTALFIRQVTQLEDEDGLKPVEVRYQIKPYQPDPSFEPVESPGFGRVGYFEANPILKPDGTTVIYAMKWNEKKKIKFSISANTPEKYRELFKNSLLYWNKTFGSDVIEVSQLEDKSITAPNFDKNIIQWVDWDEAGFAFADAHVDPRSGEVTSAQIFMPSGFFKMAGARRVRVAEAAHQKAFGIKGFKSSTLCRRNLSNDLANKESDIDVSDEAMQKAIEDYVYEVVAHELGHVLGLRHNFAGSLAATYDFKDRKEVVLSYFKNKKAPEGVVTSNSVMEYSRFEESAINGDLFRNGGAALAYDQMAMDKLYKGIKPPSENRPLFCTDSDLESYQDCKQGDAGKSGISAVAGAYKAELNAMAARMINRYIALTKYADDSNAELIAVNEVNLVPESFADRATNEYKQLISSMKHGQHFIAVVNPNRPVLATKKDEVAQKEKEYLVGEFTRLGGLQEVASGISEDFDKQIVQKFTELLENPSYNSGTRRDGSTYSFSDEEKALMINNVTIVAAKIKELLIMGELKALGGNTDAEAEDQSPFADYDLSYELAAFNLKQFERYALGKNAEEKIASKVVLKSKEEKAVELPVYKYSQQIRVTAAKTLGASAKAVDWGFVEKQKAGTLMDQELALIGDVNQIDLTELDRASLQWVLNNKKVKGQLE